MLKWKLKPLKWLTATTRKQGRGRCRWGGFLPEQSLRSLSHRWVCLTTNFIASMKQAAERRKLCSSVLATKRLMEEEGTENRDGKTFLLRSAADTVSFSNTEFPGRTGPFICQHDANFNSNGWLCLQSTASCFLISVITKSNESTSANTPSTAAEDREAVMDDCSTALQHIRTLQLFRQKLLQVRQRQPLLMVVLLKQRKETCLT